MTTRWSSTDSATSRTVQVFSSRTRVSPTSGTRFVTAYSHPPAGKRMVIDSEATGLLPPLDLARCQVGTARGRAVGSDSRVADLVLFGTLCSGADARVPVLARRPSELDEPVAHAPLVLLQEHRAQLGQRVRAGIVERPEQALTVVNRQCQDDRPQCKRLLEHAPSRLVDETGELPRTSSSGTLIPASIIDARLYEQTFDAKRRWSEPTPIATGLAAQSRPLSGRLRAPSPRSRLAALLGADPSSKVLMTPHFRADSWGSAAGLPGGIQGRDQPALQQLARRGRGTLTDRTYGGNR
jgi:hypothetical protein